ncbi:MAG: amino acid ABC transporter ATP-binding protein [Gammaproteobacteria bacterium]|nr:amino acid ABC transporter ATP-binding protein [Gammaproteobacteria bacterium]MDH3469016.1 amino acid ABC transporter ATP-binding protein [Gammaproteobacteria bacterium]
MNNVLLRVEDLHKRFGDLEVLTGVNMTLDRGHKTAIIGPSGCGKSTMLRCINFMETPSAGHVFLDGELFGEKKSGDKYVRMSEKELATQRAHVGMVFQGFYLWPHLSARDNVAIGPMKVRGMDKREANELADAMLEKVHMSHKVDEYPERLSGGQQQRVAIARALAQQPKLMLFDEPTSALDPELIGEVLNVIHELANEGRSMVLVTHEIRFAREVADRVIFLHDGIVVEEGPPDRVIDNPEHERLRGFLRQIVEH